MYNADDCLNIFLDNGYRVNISSRTAKSKTDPTDDTIYVVYETSAVHRTGATRLSCDDMTLVTSLNKLLQFATKRNPMEYDPKYKKVA